MMVARNRLRLRGLGLTNPCLSLAVVLLVLQAHSLAFAQSGHAPARLDPTLDISEPTLESTLHAPLPE